MKKIDLGQTITILANVGVIAGIAFLALEISQNTAVQESQMRFDQNERQTESIEEFFRNADLRAALLKRINGESLTQDEDFLLSEYAHRIFASFSWIYAEIQRGSMPEDVLRLIRDAYFRGPDLLRSDRTFYIDYWERYEDTSDIDSGFVNWMAEGLPVNE